MSNIQGHHIYRLLFVSFSLYYSSGDQGLIPTKKVTTQRPELFREKRREHELEIPE